MDSIPDSLRAHRLAPEHKVDVLDGQVVWSSLKSLWFSAMALGAALGGGSYFTWGGVLVFAGSTGAALLLGHSLGSHRKLIHDSYQCPKWQEYLLVDAWW